MSELDSFLEFDDSIPHSVENLDGEIKLLFSPAVIHTSKDEQGVEKREVWLQDVEIIVKQGSFFESHLFCPPSVYYGFLKCGDENSNNGVKIPFACQDDVEIQLVTPGSSIGHIVVKGNGVVVDKIGAAGYLEDFPGEHNLKP